MVTFRLPSESPSPEPSPGRRSTPSASTPSRLSPEVPGAWVETPPRYRKRLFQDDTIVSAPGTTYKPAKRAKITLDGAPTSPWRGDRQRQWFVNTLDPAKNVVRAVAKELPETPDEVDWDAILRMYRKLQNQYLVRLLDYSGLGSKTPEEKGLTDWEAWEYCDGNPNTVGQILARPGGVEEPLIWHVLISLLHAVAWLHEGRSSIYTPRDDVLPKRAPRWSPLVHNNINPDSVFFTAPREGQTYGEVKLGNFSRCKFLLNRRSLEEPINIEYFARPEHQQDWDFEAPELTWLISKDPEILKLSSDQLKEYIEQNGDEDPESGPIGGRADIWSIGAIIIALMGGAGVEKRNKTVFKPWSKEHGFTMASLHLARKGKDRWPQRLIPHHYSLPLRVMLEKLLVFDPAKRFNASQALEFAYSKRRRWMELNSRTAKVQSEPGYRNQRSPPPPKGALKGILKRPPPPAPPSPSVRDENDEEEVIDNAPPTTPPPAAAPETAEAPRSPPLSEWDPISPNSGRPKSGFGSLQWAQARRRDREAAEREAMMP